MGTVFLLALAAAVYPQLLAVVVVILTRPNPQPLLWTCYLASLTVSVGSSIALFVLLRSHESIGGTSSHRLGPSAYLALGAVALVIAIAIPTFRRRELLTGDREQPWELQQAGSAPHGRIRARTELALREGSLVIVSLVGALLAVPGPFDLLALGRLARDGYTAIAAAGVMVAFALIKFILIEVPIAAYTLDPGRTTAKVSRFSSWMQSNKLVGVAAIIGLVGIVLIGRGISALGLP